MADRRSIERQTQRDVEEHDNTRRGKHPCFDVVRAASSESSPEQVDEHKCQEIASNLIESVKQKKSAKIDAFMSYERKRINEILDNDTTINWYERLSAKRKLSDAKYRKKNKEATRAYYNENRDAIRASQAEYREENRDAKQKHYKENRDAILASRATKKAERLAQIEKEVAAMLHLVQNPMEQQDLQPSGPQPDHDTLQDIRQFQDIYRELNDILQSSQHTSLLHHFEQIHAEHQAVQRELYDDLDSLVAGSANPA